MSAIITSKFRLENASNFKEAVSTDSIYLAIGKSDPWVIGLTETVETAQDIPIPQNNQTDANDFWQSCIALKKLDNSQVTNICSRVNWEAGKDWFVPWDDEDDDIYTKKFYVITDEFKVFKLIAKTPGAVSNTKPTNINPAQQPFTLDGGTHTWKYMYTLTATEASSFLTNSYMPVKTVPASPTPIQGSEDESRLYYQGVSASDAGKIYYIALDAQGSNYTSTPTVTIHGNGTGATATAIRDSVQNKITGINVTNPGSGYSVAYVTITGGGGSGASARAILPPKNGHGTDPVSELGGFYVGMRVILSGNEGGDFIVNNAKFRQIALIKNPYSSGIVTGATTLSALKSFTITANSGTFVPGMVLENSTDPNGAKIYVDSYGSGILKYHQNDKTGYVPVTNGLTMKSNPAGSTLTVGTVSEAEVDRFTGEVLFLENRAAISRSLSQLEDIRVIVEF